MLQIANVLTSALVDAAREAAGSDGFWLDGGATAEGRARSSKKNEQALSSGPAKGVLDSIARAVLESEAVQSAAIPAALVRIMLNRYAEGMEYGAHVDAPYIDNLRTDLSFTLFLSEPSSYDGGELIVDSAGAEDCVKLPAGALALYPATSLHRVARVTRGERLAAVGWIKSRVRAAEHRDLLFDLDRIGADLRAIGAPGHLRDRLANARNNLLRAFGD